MNSIREAVDQYLEYHRELRSPNYHRDNTAVLRAWAAEITELGCSTVEEIDTSKLQSWFYRKARSVKVATVAAYLFAIKHFLAWCKDEQQLVDYNAADKVKVPRHSKAVRRVFLSLSDSERLLDSCHDEELRFALFAALHAGFRFSEVVAAKPGWFDLESKLIHIQISDEWQTKNGKPRTIPASHHLSHPSCRSTSLQGKFRRVTVKKWCPEHAMWPLGATPREARCPDMTLSPDQAIFARQLRQLGVNIAWVGSPTTVATTALKLAGPALYGSYAVSDFAADSSPTAKEFATKYEATYKSAPDFNGASTYDAVHVLKKQSIWAIISREMIFLLLLAQNDLRSHIRSG